MKAEIFRTKSIISGIVFDEKHGDLRLVDYQPGNSTRYPLTITKLPPSAARLTGYDGVIHQVTLMSDPGNLRTVLIADYEYIHHTKMEALADSVVDRVVLAELLGTLLSQPSIKLSGMRENHQHGG